MKQRERIEEMEKHFERASEVVDRLSSTLDEYAKVQDSIKALESYYGSKEWKKDFRDDEKGLLPPDLKRGVLSEDGIWNLLEEVQELKERMQSLSRKRPVISTGLFDSSFQIFRTHLCIPDINDIYCIRRLCIVMH